MAFKSRCNPYVFDSYRLCNRSCIGIYNCQKLPERILYFFHMNPSYKVIYLQLYMDHNWIHVMIIDNTNPSLFH